MDSPADLLIVDDDVVSIQLLGRLLGELGTLRFATSGAQALQLARARPPDLILLDAEMPGLSGLQTCAALKAEPELADVPVIFITSRAEEAMELEGLAAGAAHASARDRASEAGMPFRQTTFRDILRRFWPFLLLVVVILSLTTTPLPALLTVGILAVGYGAYMGARALPRGVRRWVGLLVVLLGLGAYLALAAFGGVGWSNWGASTSTCSSPWQASSSPSRLACFWHWAAVPLSPRSGFFPSPTSSWCGESR